MVKGYDAIKARIEEIIAKGFDATNKETGLLECLRVCLEAAARGIKFAPIDIETSDATVWGVIDDNTIRPPFASVDGLGDTVANNVVKERKKGKFISIEDLQNRGKVNASTIEKMRTLGILKDLPESSQLSLF